MNNYKIQDFRRNMAPALNDVTRNDAVMITSRDRPDMVLVLAEHYEELTKKAEEGESA